SACAGVRPACGAGRQAASRSYGQRWSRSCLPPRAHSHVSTRERFAGREVRARRSALALVEERGGELALGDLAILRPELGPVLIDDPELRERVEKVDAALDLAGAVAHDDARGAK